MGLESDLEAFLRTDAVYIVALVLAFVLFGVLRGFASRAGSAWGFAGLGVTMFVVGIVMLWLGTSTLVLWGTLLLVLGVVILVVAAYTGRYRSRGRSAKD